MSGKTYSIKEMKTIVDYLKNHNAYGDIKGRKMWMDFANSSITNRTWQSLKETFLKRILPDIHNPYYNLTREEMISFKQGFDVNARRKNKLEIHTISDDSSSNNDNQKYNQQPNTSKVIGGDKATGENSKSSKIDSHDRASTETVVLEPCYETPQDIQRALESPNNESNEESGNDKPSTKSFRDFITYAEPLTPMLQEVLHDFATDDEEPELQIVENIVSDTNDQEPNESPENTTKSGKKENITDNDISKSRDNIEKRLEEQVPDIKKNSDAPDILKTSARLENPKILKDCSVEKNSDSMLESFNVDINMSTQKTIDSSNSNKQNTNSVEVTISHKNLERNETQNCSHSTSDTLLPGNQEALKTSASIEQKDPESLINLQTNKNGNKKITGRKRANSDIKPNPEKKKRTMGVNNKLKSVSEAGSSPEDKQIDFKIPSRVKLQIEETVKSSILEKDVNAILNNENTANKEKKIFADSDESQPPQMNPCLNSVSLYAEQFNKTKYTDSDSSENSKAKKNINIINKTGKNNNNKKKNDKNKNEHIPETLQIDTNMKTVIKVSSPSESSGNNIQLSDLNQDESDNKKVRNVNNSERDKALASVFGFACGTRRKRKLSYRKSSHRYYSHSSAQLESSEWTSDSEDEYVSPPRGRRSIQSRKFLKPKSARVLSVKEDGGLFVMHDKRIYPIVKDGKTVKNYLTYSSESDIAEDPSYWKKKYEDEKMKAEGFKKLLEESKENKSRACSPILSIPSLPKLPAPHVPSPMSSRSATTSTTAAPSEVKQPEVKDVEKSEKTLKIKFTKNNEELQVEGHWSHIHPVLADVVQLFNKDTAPGQQCVSAPRHNAEDVAVIKDTEIKNHNVNAPVETAASETDSEVLSIGPSAVIDEEVHDKVAKLESEIFKEIEERDNEAHNDTVSKDEHVNKRRGRPRNSSTSKKSPSLSASETRTSLRMKNKSDQAAEVVENTNPTVNNNKQKAKTTGKKNVTVNDISSNEQKSDDNYNLNTVENEDDISIRYKLPTTRKTREKQIPQKMATNTTKSKLQINGKSKSHSSEINAPVSLSLNTESTEGYQDSDFSPIKERILLKRKRKLSLSTVLHRDKIRRRHVRRSYHCLADDASSESSNLSFNLPNKITPKLPPNDNSSLNSEVYQSDSYRLLVLKEKQPFKLLDRIEEANPLYNDDEMSAQNSNLQVIVDYEMSNLCKNSCNSSVCQNSSNVTLPLSPELSVVENISISKNLINGIADNPTINETQLNVLGNSGYSKYMMSEIDITMPLMGQDCEIQKSVSPNQSLTDQKSPAISESFLSKINPVDIADAPSISDSLDNKLRNLLLESAKKMQVDTTEIIMPNNSVLDKKSRAKKRCSTPRKKTSTIKFSTPDIIEPVIEEEYTECCSYGGRKSCPPAIHTLLEGAIVNKDHINASENEAAKTKGRKKKDIIKVKILKPMRKDCKKTKSPDKCSYEEKAQDQCNISVHTDSGINEPASGLFIHNTDDSVDLIHNHSETCLQTKECLDDSVELVEPQAKSIISLNTDSEQFLRDTYFEISEFKDVENICSELHCNNAHDGFGNVVNVKPGCTNSLPTDDTVYHSPISVKDLSNSLITEDLSDESPSQSSLPAKWYLLSEDETTKGPSFGANLMQIFPLACAVPNLSTVTEISKENEGSNPADLEGDTRNDFDSQSIF